MPHLTLFIKNPPLGFIYNKFNINIPLLSIGEYEHIKNIRFIFLIFPKIKVSVDGVSVRFYNDY